MSERKIRVIKTHIELRENWIKTYQAHIVELDHQISALKLELEELGGNNDTMLP